MKNKNRFPLPNSYDAIPDDDVADYKVPTLERNDWDANALALLTTLRAKTMPGAAKRAPAQPMVEVMPA